MADPIDEASEALKVAAKALRQATKREQTVSGNLQEARQALVVANAEFERKAEAFTAAIRQPESAVATVANTK